MFRTPLRAPLFLVLLAAPLAGQAPSAPEARPVLGVDPAYMDPAAPACKDFYRFANGAYDREPIPAAYAAFGVNEEIDQRNEVLLKDILSAAAKDLGAAPGSAARRIGDFYRSGMDLAAIERAGLQPLQPLLKRVAAMKSTRELGPVLALLHAQGIDGGFGCFPEIDDKDSASMTVRLRQGGLGLPERPERDFYFRDDATTKAQRAAYVRHIGRMFELSGWKEEVARASAERVMALETSLAKASKKLVDLRDPEGNYHKVKREELPTLAPNFPWEPYFRAIGLPDFQKELVVGQPDFFRAFSEAINVFPLSDWKIYLRWHLLRSTSAYLGKDFEEERFAFFQKTLSGLKEMLPRWKRVLRALDGAVGEDLGQLYVRRAFSSEAKRRVLEMIHFHREALRASILRAPWMGEATKAQALRKLDAMRAKVGYPDVWRDYSGLQVRAQPYVLNVLAGEAFEFRRQMAKLGKPVDRNEWGMTPQTNNAYYNPTLNEIALPAGILQPPFFVEQADDASNYGALASTIGHEILHGFDDKGSQFDADGNLRNWWTPEDRQAYLAQTEKVVKQYEAYEPVPGVHVQGHQTLGENLADIGGLKISYEAWKLASAGKPAAPQGVFSPEQRFFIAFAQGWRTNERPERTRLILQSDVHSPIRWRVLGPVAALPEFQQAFGCKDGDPMAAHEERRFTIW